MALFQSFSGLEAHLYPLFMVLLKLEKQFIRCDIYLDIF